MTEPVAVRGPSELPGTERLRVRAGANGVEYQLEVALPAEYEKSDERYPVFYLLDGNLAFPTAVQAYRCQRIEGGLPEVIVVGIGYPEQDPSIGTIAYQLSRARDYTPTVLAHKPTANEYKANLDETGKADEFLAFITDRLLPLIDGRYRTDPRALGLGGHSLGGLFTTYVLLTDPSIFNRYWIGSPSLWFNDGEPFRWVSAATGRSVKPAGRALLTVGGLETEIMVSPMERMARELADSFPLLEVEARVFPDETHMSVLGASINRALPLLYGKKAIAMTREETAGYAATWRAESGETMEIRLQGDELIATIAVSSGFRMDYTLAAESIDQLFFAHYEQFRLSFERDAVGKPVRLHRTLLGQDFSFERA